MTQINPQFVPTLVGNFWVPRERNTQNGKKVVLNLTCMTEDGDKRIVSFWPGEMRDSKEPMLGNGLSVLIAALVRKELWNQLPEAMQSGSKDAVDAVHTELLKLTTKVATPFQRGDIEAAKGEAEYLNERLAGKIVLIDFEANKTYTDTKTGETRPSWEIPGSATHHCPVAPSDRETDDTFAGEKVSELLVKMKGSGGGLTEEQHAEKDAAILAAITGGAKAAKPAGKPATAPGNAPF